MKGEMFDYFGHAFDPIFYIFQNGKVKNLKKNFRMIQFNIEETKINAYFKSNTNLKYTVYFDNSTKEILSFDEYFDCFRLYLLKFIELFNKKNLIILKI